MKSIIPITIFLLLSIVRVTFAQGITSTNGNYYTGTTSTPQNFIINTGTVSPGTPTVRATFLASNGNFGIGTAAGSIAERLHVTGNTRTSGNFITDAGIFNVNSSTLPMIFQTNTTERMRIVTTGAQAGFVGIGGSPTEKLHVIGGNIFTNGNYLSSSGIFNVNAASTNFSLQLNASERFRVTPTYTYVVNTLAVGTTPSSTDYVIDAFRYGEAKMRLMTQQTGTNAIYDITATSVTGTMESNNSGSAVRVGARTAHNLHLIANNTNYFTMLASGGMIGLNKTPSSSYQLDVNGIVNASDIYVNGAQMWTIASGNAYRASGYVGIGIVPSEKLHVNGNMILENSGSSKIFTGVGGTDLNRFIHISNTPTLQIPAGLKAGGILVADSYAYATPGDNDLVVKGKVTIGTPVVSASNPYELAVKGMIGAYDLKIEKTSSAWADYVFEKNYELAPLKDVEKYIEKNGHLKDVPSAKEIEKDGYHVSTMDATLLRKIEELTLYLIQQQKEIEELKKQLAEKK